MGAYRTVAARVEHLHPPAPDRRTLTSGGDTMQETLEAITHFAHYYPGPYKAWLVMVPIAIGLLVGSTLYVIGQKTLPAPK